MRFYFTSRLILLFSICLYSSAGLVERDSSQPTEIYQPPPIILLDQANLNSLQHQRAVLKKYLIGDNTQQAIVFRVSASAKNIWSVITNFKSYPTWIKEVKQTNIYRQDRNNYYVDFVISHWLLGKYRYSVWHYLSDNGWMRWQLDHSKTSDFAWSKGFWKVVAVPNETDTYDVYYSADLQFKKPRSQWLRRKIIRAGLKQASLWVKHEAEKLTQ